MTRPVLLGTLILLALACGGLSADFAGTQLTLNRNPWELETCWNGDAKGFQGVEVLGKDRSRARFATRADGKVDVFVMEPGGAEWHALGDCGTMSFEQTSITINDVKALRGGGTVACEGGAHELVGTLQVETCATELF